MASRFLVQKRALWLAILLGVLCMVTSVFVYAQVRGQMTLGQAGALSGALTLMPPDGTGWYHIDNPGNQMIRISSGGRPGQFVYMIISHPGKVTVHGDLEVTGVLRTRNQVRVTSPRPAGGSSASVDPGRADSATSGDVQTLQFRVDQLTAQVKDLDTRVRALTR